ncbi:MAG: hypothetical protein HQ500_07015 [Flavobacteriales bacterium]|nr:hypothetical protein [Flavobacteriales bacterium]
MIRINMILVVLCILTIGCAKNDQYKKTQFEFVLNDITTGVMNERGSVSLLEVETPSQPFSPLIFTEIKKYDVSYGEYISDEFNANRGNRFQYVVRFNRDGGEYYSGLVYEGNTYEISEECTLSKKQENSCEMLIEPTAHVSLRATNLSGGASESDSIWAQISDGYVQRGLNFKGKGESSAFGGEVPHGFYDLNYWIYRNGELSEEVSSSFYLNHNQDTAITIQF